MNYGATFDSLLTTMATPVDPSYQDIFSTFSLSDNSSVYSSQLWGGGGSTIDWTSIGHKTNPSSTFYCKMVAITPRHAITSEHNAVGFNIGEEVTWIAHNGTLVTRTILDVEHHIGDPDEANSFRVIYLNSDLPATINNAPLFADTTTNIVGQPAIKVDQFHLALTCNVAAYVIAYYFLFEDPGSGNRHVYYGDWVGNDSGSPAFMLSPQKQLLYMTSAVGGGVGSGPKVAVKLPQIMAACAALDARNANTGYLPRLFTPTPFNSGLSLGLAVTL